MFSKGQHLKAVRTLGMAAVVAMGLASCATYDDEFATINSRLDQLDTRVQGAAQSAQEANQRLDRMENRVQQLETAPPRVPRG
jgi:murein lipoprotein